MSGCDCHSCSGGEPPPPLKHTCLHRLMAPWLHLTGTSCRHFIDLASARLDRRLTFGEGLRYRFHWLICRYCRLAGPQYVRLVELTRMHDEVPSAPLSRETLRRFSDALDQTD